MKAQLDQLIKINGENHDENVKSNKRIQKES
jgi:hypothetical protein